jgi:Carboxypeptidase regulatory-like domain/TonB-dependent Receptor Plug Domain/TonB dependent receptor
VKKIIASICGLLAALTLPAFAQTEPASWHGVLRDASGQRISGARVELRGAAATVTAHSRGDGSFEFEGLAPGKYALEVDWSNNSAHSEKPIDLAPAARLTEWLRVSSNGGVAFDPSRESSEATGGEQLSSRQVSALPLNKRDFSQLLLLAAGTQTDTNGAANFTQQFTVNGQRGTATVFAMDGIDTTDPEMGGATFSNFNVDAIQEIRSNSGVMAAEIGHGAAGFTEIVTKSGTNDLHGSVFEFVRNAAFDARNFFDRRSIAQPGRIPPFIRNEFGFANGGPVVLPRVHDGRDRTFYYYQYQGFRQVLGTTQVVPVPMAAERQGLNTTAFPGDTLFVPVSSKIASVLARYPMPNDPQGPYGARTYATSSKVHAVSDQFSLRIDHRISEKSHLFGRFNFNNVDGPLTNPSQTAIDRSFAVKFFDHQRNFGLSYTRTPSATFISESSIGFVRSTPNFPTVNSVQPGLLFADGLYEAFNTASGSIMASFGNLFQFRQNFTWIRGNHTWKAGAEARFNRDTTLFGTNPNGTYTFGGGAAFSPVEIRSSTGLHDIHVGDPLPDALTGLLTATPFAYTVTAAPAIFAQGARMGDSAARRNAYNFYFQDNWKVSPSISVSYGLRYEVSSRIAEAKQRSSGVVFEDANGRPGDMFSPGTVARFVVNKQPPYLMDWGGWGPRLAIDWRLNDKTVFRAGGAITTMLVNLWQDNMVTGGLPFVVAPILTAAPGAPVPFENVAAAVALPPARTPSGALIFPTGRSTDVAANTELDVLRFERDLAALSPDGQTHPITGFALARDFRNGYIGTYTASVERTLTDVTLSAAYVATAGIKLARLDFPNAYAGADPQFAPYTVFDSTGAARAGYGPIFVTSSRSHSTYHSLQTGLGKNSLRYRLGFQVSYTFSKSIDDTSAVLGGFIAGGSGAVLQASPQNPRDLRGEKGPSTFDITHALSFSAIQELPLDRLFRSSKRLSSGWQLLGLGSLASGAPFSVYSGIQQTGVGSNGADRPDQITQPDFSTSRTVREDYFGRGANNASFFSIPIGVPGGTGPNKGRFGTLGRNTFRGSGFHNFDMALVKDTPVGLGSNPERVVAQFRAEFFDVFNLVNFGLPSNIVLGPGFGIISRTSGPSRQIQLSLKLIY